MAGGKAPPLGGDDERLWRRIARTVDPLPGRARPDAPERREGGDGAVEGPSGSAAGAARPLKPPGRGEAASGAPGGGLDRRQAQRFRRGRMPIDARCDLHGMTRREARAALDAFLARARKRGCRCVLVITGKGQRSPLAERTGVLRGELPLWLEAPSNRDRVLDFAQAQPRDGGDGAFYILLRKPR